ncbi:MAG: hypothetical protein ABIH68_06085 [bacterium]
MPKIICHNDFDGAACAAICKCVFPDYPVVFAGIQELYNLQITPQDIICDLPYPRECGLWFDHHAGNFEELKLREMNIESIPGIRREEKSCAKIVFEYFKEKGLPDFLAELVAAADKVDSMDYENVEQYIAETPDRIAALSIDLKSETYGQKLDYMKFLADNFTKNSLTRICEMDEVKNRYNAAKSEEKRDFETIEKYLFFLTADEGKEIGIIDGSQWKRKNILNRNLAYILFPHIVAVSCIDPVFQRGIKTNDLHVSTSLNPFREPRGKDIGEIFRELNIGSGHRGAAGGVFHYKNKQERILNYKKDLERIFILWKKQKPD